MSATSYQYNRTSGTLRYYDEITFHLTGTQTKHTPSLVSQRIDITLKAKTTAKTTAKKTSGHSQKYTLFKTATTTVNGNKNNTVELISKSSSISNEHITLSTTVDDSVNVGKLTYDIEMPPTGNVDGRLYLIVRTAYTRGSITSSSTYYEIYEPQITITNHRNHTWIHLIENHPIDSAVVTMPERTIDEIYPSFNTTMVEPGPAVDNSGDYVFTGWYTDSACTNRATFPFSAPTEFVQLYAGWAKRVPFRIKMNGQWDTGTLKTKVNGEWVNATSAFLKVNGDWEEIVE